MVILTTQSEFGEAPPPCTPYSVISNLPGWNVTAKIRDGDMSDMARVKNIYPRFAPMQFAAQLGAQLATKLGREGKGVMMYLHPDMWPYTMRSITHEHRKEHIMKPEDVELRCVDVAGHRLYLVLFERTQTFGVMLSWTNPGLGLSIRGAEQLLTDIDGMAEVPFDPQGPPPEPSWTPESSAHQGIRDRVCALLHRAANKPELVTCTPDDVYLHPTGMGSVFHTTNLLMKHRPGTIVVLGIVFHNTHHHLVEECPHGMKHFGAVDDAGLDEFEAWLEAEAQAARPVSYGYVEVPGNPNLETPDLPRVKKLAEKYGFVLIVDDTVGSSANIDVFPYADIVLTSLTKSFSGLADVMAGSIVLNPLSPHYGVLAPLFKTTHHNELFAADADVLLSNSAQFLERTQILNRNAHAMASFLHEQALDPASPVTVVQYPPLLSTGKNMDALLRRGTPELPHPGYGCLLTVQFESVEAAAAFYDSCGLYPSPHLGGHVTLMFAYSMLVFSKDPEEKQRMERFGVTEASIRLSAGLESEEDLVDTLRHGLEVAGELVKNKRNQQKV